MSNKIKIPKGLPLAVAHSKSLRKALETWLILKRDFDRGYMHVSRQNLIELQDSLCISHTTILKRLRIAQANKLVRFTRISKSHHLVHLCSWEQLASIFGLTGGYYYVKPEFHEAINLEHWLEAKAIEEKQLECKDAYYKRIAKYAIKHELIKGVMDGKQPKGSFTEAALMAHLKDYVDGKQSPYSYLFDFARADINVGYKRLTDIFA